MIISIDSLKIYINFLWVERDLFAKLCVRSLRPFYRVAATYIYNQRLQLYILYEIINLFVCSQRQTLRTVLRQSFIHTQVIIGILNINLHDLFQSCQLIDVFGTLLGFKLCLIVLGTKKLQTAENSKFQIKLTQSLRSSCTDHKATIIRNNSLPHRCWQNWDIYSLGKFSQFQIRSTVCSSLTWIIDYS